jgi:hypothetical protein
MDSGKRIDIVLSEGLSFVRIPVNLTSDSERT